MKKDATNIILSQIKSLSTSEKWLLLVGPINLLLYFVPVLHEIGLFKLSLVINSFLLIAYFSTTIFKKVYSWSKVNKQEKWFLILITLAFLIFGINTLNMEKGVHQDELWRIDRSRQFVVFNDFEYGNFIGYPLNKALVGAFSLVGVAEKELPSLINNSLLTELHGGDFTSFTLRIFLGLVPSIAIIWLLYPILKKKYSPSIAWIGVTLLVLSYTFLHFSRTFLTEPLLGYLFALFLSLTVLIFNEKKYKERKYLQTLILPLFITAFLTKYTFIIVLPLALYILFFQRTPKDKAEIVKNILTSASIFIAFMPQVLTVRGLISFTKGPVRGILPYLQNEYIIDTDMILKLIPIALLVLVIGFIFVLLSLKKAWSTLTSKENIFNKNYPFLLSLGTVLIVILSFFEANDFIWAYHPENMFSTDTLLFFCVIGCSLYTLWKIKDATEEEKVFTSSLFFFLVSTAYISNRILLVTERHLFVFLPLTVFLSTYFIWQVSKYIKRVSKIELNFTSGIILIAAVLFSTLQLLRPEESMTFDRYWEYNYWTIDPEETYSLKEFTYDIAEFNTDCNKIIFDSGRSQWSRYYLAGIAYYMPQNTHSTDCNPDIAETQKTDSLRKLKVLDLYLRSERQEQLENPYSTGLYSRLIPLMTSQGIEDTFSTEMIIDEYLKNTDAEVLITNRTEIVNSYSNITFPNGTLKLVKELPANYKAYKIVRNYSQSSDISKNIDGKNYSSADFGLEVLVYDPSDKAKVELLNTGQSSEEIPKLFDYVFGYGPTEIKFEKDGKSVEKLTYTGYTDFYSFDEIEEK